MIPVEIYSEDVLSTVIRFGLYVGAAFQLICMIACFTYSDEETEDKEENEGYSDSDEYSSEQSSPGHRMSLFRARRFEKKKRR